MPTSRAAGAQLADEVLPLAHRRKCRNSACSACGTGCPTARAAARAGSARVRKARKSECSSAKRACCWSACARFSAGRSRGSWIDSAGGDHDDLVRAAEPVGLEHHPRRSAGRPAAARAGGRAASARPPSLAPRRSSAPQLVQQVDRRRGPGGGRAGRGTGSPRSSPRPSAAICRITDARFVRRISGSVKRGRSREVVLGVEPDADAVRRAPAAALALVGRGLRDRLDRQPLHLQPRAVAADPRGARVDDVADPRHRQRRLGDVRREHDAAAAAMRA